jgi:hypothetical protein
LRGEEQRRIEGNLITIRHYLKSKFPGYTITEHSVPSLYHEFTVTNMRLHKNYGLKVGLVAAFRPWEYSRAQAPNLDFKTSFHSTHIGIFKGNGSKNVT